MIAAEQCFYTINNSPVRAIRARVEALNPDSSIKYTFKYTDRLKSFSIERTGDNTRFFGYGVCHRLNLKIIDTGREIELTTANRLDVSFGIGCDYLYSFPYFEISEIHRDENTNELSITAYDVLYKAANHTTAELDKEPPYTIETFTMACAALLGLPLKIHNVKPFQLFYETGANFEGTETIREALNAVAEATQSIYFINNQMELEFKQLTTETALTIDREMYFTLKSSTNRRLEGLAHITELGNNVEVNTGVSGTIQYIRNNAFYELREDIDSILYDALSSVAGLTINQFETEWRGNPLLEIGDRIGLILEDGSTVYSYLLNDTLEYNGTMRQITSWQYSNDETETDTNPATLGDALKQTFAKVDKINREIEIVASENAENKNSIAALRLDTESVAASVERVETAANAAFDNVNGELETITNRVNAAMTADGVKLSIQEELEKGVNKVYTETGFSFDADGLKVSRTGSEMETLLDEDGLSVFRDNTEVLTADNTGVNGINMTVRQYLIVGGSRFENYGGRTGCFWVGG